MLLHNAPRLEANSFTAMAIMMIPKNFLSTYTPLLPIACSTRLRLLRTKNTKIILISKPIIISGIVYSARIDSNEVNVAGPARRGNTTGTMVAELFGESFLNTSTPNVISTDIIKITMAPATAKALTSTLNRRNNPSPTKRNTAMMMKAKSAACKAFICRPLLVNPKKMGTDPSTSIKANRNIVILRMLVKLIDGILKFPKMLAISSANIFDK